MLEVVNSIPIEGFSTHYVDGEVKLTFNKEVADVSLNNLVFTLYSQYPKTGGGYTYQATAISIFKSTGDHNTIVIVPTQDLANNQEYVLTIRGDRDLTDAIKQGILSTDNEIMDGNFALNFRTGTEHAPTPTIDIDVTPDTTPIDTEDNPYVNISDGVSTSPTGLEVINVTPSDLFNISTVADLLIEFNEYIVASDIQPFLVDGFHIDSEGRYIPLRVQDVLVEENKIKVKFNGVTCVSGEYVYVENTSISGEMLETSMLPLNHKYRITLLKSKIQGISTNHVLAGNIQIEIDSPLFPKFANAYETRTHSHGLLGDNVSDQLIEASLRDSTKKMLDRIGAEYSDCAGLRNLDQQLYNYIKQYAMCKTIYDLYNTKNNVAGGSSGVKSKRLGDFSISYSSDDSDDSSNPAKEFETCMEDAYHLIMAATGGTAKAATKSANTFAYPGRPRSAAIMNKPRNYPTLKPSKFTKASGSRVDLGANRWPTIP